MRFPILLCLQGVIVHTAILPPPWADPNVNPCSTQPGGWLKLFWPPDGQCYRIFQRGSPCPPTMELTPGANGAECSCPPGQLQREQDSPCYQIYSPGPCSKHQYLAPTDDTRSRRGVCKDVPKCTEPDEMFWPANSQCYTKYTRGPCPLGQLLVRHNRTGLAECACENSGPLSRFYWGPSKTCHQFYTKGPCLEKGALYLPGPQCGCHPSLPNYYPKTEQCYEIGTAGPCKTGQTFMGTPTGCVCKPDHVPWLDGHCYRAFTRGPCSSEQLISADGLCRTLPCPRGKLYFPDKDACHRVGVRGPCARGQLVLFEQSVRPAIEGISYRGMCGCPGSGKCNDESEVQERKTKLDTKVESSMPKVTRNAHIDYSTATLCEPMEDGDGEMCYQLYTQGPCRNGEWLVPNRQSRSKRRATRTKIPTSIGVYIGHRFNGGIYESSALPPKKSEVPELFQDRNDEGRTMGRCECKPGFSLMKDNQGCQLPLVALARFLNGKDYFT